MVGWRRNHDRFFNFSHTWLSNGADGENVCPMRR